MRRGNWGPRFGGRQNAPVTEPSTVIYPLIGVAFGAVLGLAGSLIPVWVAGRRERDARLFDLRRDAYVKLIDAAENSHGYGLAGVPFETQLDRISDVKSAFAVVRLYGDKSTVAAAKRLLDYLADLVNGQGEASGAPLRHVVDEQQAQIEAFLECARRDLGLQ